MAGAYASRSKYRRAVLPGYAVAIGKILNRRYEPRGLHIEMLSSLGFCPGGARMTRASRSTSSASGQGHDYRLMS